MRSVLQKQPALPTQLCWSPALHGMQRGAGLALHWCGVPVGPSPPTLAADSPEYPWDVCVFPRKHVQIHKSKDVENLWFILFKNQ